MASSVPNMTELGFHKAEGPMLHHFRNEVRSLLNVDGFPGSQPISFARSHVEDLKRRNYWVCEKSDGVRTLLYFTRQMNAEGGQSEMHFLIDRKNEYYVVPNLHFPKAPAEPGAPIDFGSWHADTMLDGELLWDTYPDGKRVLKYLAFDVLALDGKLLIDRPLDKRIRYFKDWIIKPYKALRDKFPDDCEMFPFVLEEKSFTLAYGTADMFSKIMPNLRHGNDGLIFTCQETPYVFKTDSNILKWKPAEENTVDFRLGLEFPVLPQEQKRGPDDWDYDYDAPPRFVLYAWAGDDEGDIEFADMYADPHEFDKLKTWSLENDDGLIGQVVECHQDDHGRWRFARFRPDKKDANHISVIRKVLASIRDGVTKEELMAEAGPIRSAWKARESARKLKAEQNNFPGPTE